MAHKHLQKVELSLPEWLPTFLEKYPETIVPLKERMEFVLALTAKNIQEQTGGPFGAAVFEKNSGKLVGVGVNRVVTEGVSSAHAEVMALTFAQRNLGVFDLGGEQLPDHQLVVNAQMCAMCLGAVCWSGVREVVFAATGADVEKLTGFDEGPVSPNYQQDLEQRGISVLPEFMRAEGCEVLQLYMESGGLIYNARQG